MERKKGGKEREREGKGKGMERRKEGRRKREKGNKKGNGQRRERGSRNERSEIIGFPMLKHGCIQLLAGLHHPSFLSALALFDKR